MIVCINVILSYAVNDTISISAQPHFICIYSGHQGSAKQAANTTLALKVYIMKFLVNCN